MRILLFFILLVLPTWAQAQRDFMADARSEYTFSDADYRNVGFLNSNASSKQMPGYVSVLSSALVPGSGQMMQGKWAKGAAFLLVEALSVYVMIERRNFAQRTERLYHELGDAQFSVVLYADWLVRYNQFYGRDVDLQSLATPGSVLNPNAISANARNDWGLVDINALRALEMSTLFGGNSGNAFSHVMPDYGSQQYYELMSKYFQFGPGWPDFGIAPGPIIWGKESMSPFWFQHGEYGRDFNDAYRMSASMVNLIVFNHFVSFFDAMISNRKRNVEFSAEMTPMNTPALRARIAFR